jgi:hypothetical protein
MSLKVNPFGKVEVTVPASGKISAVSKSPYKIYQKAGYPNQPDTWGLLKAGAADEEYASAAFTPITVVRIEAGASEVFYNVGTDAVPVEKRGAVNQPAPVALDSTGALTAAMIAAGIITSTTAAAVAGTVPTGTVLDAALQLNIGEAIDFSVIATGANAFTVTAASGVTIVGAAAVATATSGRFRLRKTAAATYIIYRLS